MASRSLFGVRNAAREARRVLNMTEAAALWNGETFDGPVLGAFPWQGRGASARGGAGSAKTGASEAALPPGPEEDRSLTTIANRLGSDRGSKTRLAETYHMVLQHLRDRRPTVLELVPAPAPDQPLPPHGQLWAAYFPGARIGILAPTPVPAPQEAEAQDSAVPGAFWLQADPETRPALAGALDALGALDRPDLVIDNGSHASHHQQNAFLELFPRLASGGFYIIEGLRDLPAALERPGISRCTDLFRGFSEKRRFSHSDTGTEAAFAALAPQISGVLTIQANYNRNRRDIAVVIHKR